MRHIPENNHPIATKLTLILVGILIFTLILTAVDGALQALGIVF